MKVLFVCIGNICRSPMAEGILKKLVKDHGLNWTVDSAGIAYFHVGESPDPRAIRTSQKFGVDISRQKARRIKPDDFKKFDLIYALANDVQEELGRLRPDAAAEKEILLLLDEVFPGEKRSVYDPYYDEEHAFEIVFREIENACRAVITNRQLNKS